MLGLFVLMGLLLSFGCGVDGDSPTGPVGEDITVDLPGGVSMDLVWIEPGTFVLGSPASEEGRRQDEGPQHEVEVSQGFWLGKYEITQAQWEAVMGTTPWSGQDFVQPDPNHPAVYISWEDLQLFVGRLNRAAGEALYRLPTEAEWAYACRAGTTTRWSFGDDESRLGDYAWYHDNTWEIGLEHPQPVGKKRPNPWGLYDMHGNVWEWCLDLYGSYSNRSQIDPSGPDRLPLGRPERVMRGGNFSYNSPGVRSAIRHGRSSLVVNFLLGARLLRTK